MNINIKGIEMLHEQVNRIILVDNIDHVPQPRLSDAELQFIKSQNPSESKIYAFNHFDHQIWLCYNSKKGESHLVKESFRKQGSAILSQLQNFGITEIYIEDYSTSAYSLYFAEGMALGAYRFDKYKSKKSDEKYLSQIFIYNPKISEREIVLANISIEATYWSRNLLNEPQSVINATTLTEEFQRMAEDAGFTIDVFNKRKIESLKMGGLLAVNMGSLIPPSFSVMTYKPENAINAKPYIFVGKGVVFDTGGLNIKTGDFMTNMHMDMGGAAAVSTALYAIAKAKLPVYVIAIVPATDNRPGQNAYAPNDIITLHNGKTVEILNTDAEGRLILADALSYAQSYAPELVIDLATLTGAAARAIGKYGIVAMRNSQADISLLNQSSLNVYERLAEFPMWEEYDELIKSDFADLKNIGGVEAGAITAGKFLEHFVDYPWIHLDIAGPAMLTANDSYRTKGGPGVGTRLLFDFILNVAEKHSMI